MGMTLSEQLNEMRLGDHLCLVYENQEEQMAAIVPYLKQGLERNEVCVYITDDRTLEEVRTALIRGGIDLDSEIARGAFTFATKRDSYLQSGSFDPDLMVAFLENSVRNALERGFSGFRVTGEMTWALGGDCGCQRLIEYEAKLNHYFPSSKATAICQYNRNRFQPEVIRDVLRTHPIAIIGNKVCPNLYFENPSIVLEDSSVGQKVDWMIHQLTKYHESEQRLKEAIVTRDEFLSVASHELKTPLTTLSIQIQMLEKSAKAGSQQPVSAPEIEKRIDMAARQTRKLTALVDTLLDLTRANADQVSIDVTECEVSSVITEVVQRFSEEANQKGILLHMRALASVRAEVDRMRFDQVLSNLLSNALKYGEDKPVEIELRSTPSSFQVLVKDHGIGVSDEDKRRIFSRFERAVSGQNISGLGLGLYIADEIVKAHGGQITLESEFGQGSTFAVEVPIRRAVATGVA